MDLFLIGTLTNTRKSKFVWFEFKLCIPNTDIQFAKHFFRAQLLEVMAMSPQNSTFGMYA